MEIKRSKERITVQKKEMLTLLENLGQGFMIFDEEGVVRPGSTKIVKKFFGLDPTGRNIEDIFELNALEKSSFKKWCLNVWNGRINFKDLVSLAPQNYIKDKKQFFSLEYRPIYKNKEKQEIESVICIASDKTKEWELKKKALERKRRGLPIT